MGAAPFGGYHAERERRGARTEPVGGDAGAAAGLALPCPGRGVRVWRPRRGGLAASSRAGAARAPAQPVGRGHSELGAPPRAALPAPHAVGQAHW